MWLTICFVALYLLAESSFSSKLQAVYEMRALSGHSHPFGRSIPSSSSLTTHSASRRRATSLSLGFSAAATRACCCCAARSSRCTSTQGRSRTSSRIRRAFRAG
eukprot:6205139-Pleurochrysis_carterae.AAC.2